MEKRKSQESSLTKKYNVLLKKKEKLNFHPIPTLSSTQRAWEIISSHHSHSSSSRILFLSNHKRHLSFLHSLLVVKSQMNILELFFQSSELRFFCQRNLAGGCAPFRYGISLQSFLSYRHRKHFFGKHINIIHIRKDVECSSEFEWGSGAEKRSELKLKSVVVACRLNP